MTIKRIFLAAFCMLAVSLANAQTATIKGFVYAAHSQFVLVIQLR